MKSSTLFKLFLLIIGLNIFQIQFLYAQSCYELVWSDEFNVPGLPDSAKWSYDVGGGGWGNNELQYYTSERPENARIEDSVLIIEARKEAYSGKQYTSARLITHYNGHAWKYGKIEAKIKLPYGQGIWPAFWMLGESMFNGISWPACGEIDIMEMVGGGEGRDDKTYGTIHWADAANNHAQYGGSYQLAQGIFADTFHIFSMEWNATTIKWFLDGNQFHVVDITPTALSEFHQNYFIILNVAVGGNWPGSPTSSTVFPQQMAIDYVRVYQLNQSPEITGSNMVVKGEKNVEFSTIAFDGYTYNWTVPESATILSGQGTSAIRVNWGCEAGNVTCELTTLCDTYNLEFPVAIEALSIEGETIVMAGQENLRYAIAQTLETSYVWTLPASVTSTATLDTNVIYVDWGYADGTLKVVTDNFCGKDSALLNVTVLRQLPYPDINTPAVIPGTIQSVNYDFGGEGIAYHDIEPENQGNGSRQDEGVDTETNDGGESIGWTKAGEWLEYSIDVQSEKTYDAEIRIASINSAGKLKILYNGEDRTGVISVPSTGSWSKFKSIYLDNIQLKESDTLMRVEIVNGDFNLGRFVWADSLASDIPSIVIKDALSVYPTLTDGIVHVQNLTKTANYSITDVTGKLVLNGRVEPQGSIDGTRLTPGSYCIIFTDDDATQVLKFVKY